MKCVCRVKCQVRVGPKIRTFRVGAVHDFTVCPTHFEPIEGEKALTIDFLTAGRDELVAAKWTFNDAHKVIFAAFGKKLVKEEGTKKSEIIEQILDARYRAVTTADTDHTR